jgi:hypothetical protein
MAAILFLCNLEMLPKVARAASTGFLICYGLSDLNQPENIVDHVKAYIRYIKEIEHYISYTNTMNTNFLENGNL